MHTNITETIATYVLSVYHAMDEQATDEDGVRVFEGSIANLVRDLGISMTYYSPIFRTLYDHGYCAALDRGGRAKPSRVVLLQEPQKDEIVGLTLNPSEPIVPIVNRIEALERNLGGLYVVGILQEIERRIVALEGHFSQLLGGPDGAKAKEALDKSTSSK